MWDDLSGWLKRPFQSDQDATHWFLFIGLILASLYCWHVIYRDYRSLED